MSAPASVLQILSRQTRQETLDCPECEGRGERLLFDQETGSDYHQCEACQGTGYNLLGLLVCGLLKPPESGYGPQELKEILKQQITQVHQFQPQKTKKFVQHANLQTSSLNQSSNHQTTLELQYGHQKQR